MKVGMKKHVEKLIRQCFLSSKIMPAKAKYQLNIRVYSALKTLFFTDSKSCSFAILSSTIKSWQHCG